MRTARLFVWVSPEDCIAPHGLDLEADRDAGKVDRLRKAFAAEGFDLKEPALVGYPLDGKIQLLSGTHRHLAAQQAGIKLPVTLWLATDVGRMWGTELWATVIEDIPVEDLQEAKYKDGVSIPPYEPVDLSTYGAA